MSEHSSYQDEVRRRWGDTEQWRIASERTKAYGPAEHALIAAEQGTVSAALGRLMAEGRGAEDPAVQAEVERWRQVTERWFYPCDDAQLARLADLYEADERFRKSFDAQAPGLGRFVIEAFRHGRTGGEGVT